MQLLQCIENIENIAITFIDRIYCYFLFFIQSDKSIYDAP